MKIVLITMIRNESAIIKRCLTAVEDIVDAYCVHDTGSTDNTCEVVDEFLKTRVGCLTQSEWRNFGYNRTQSFIKAHDYVRDTLLWDLKDTFGLLLDADMVFVPGTLRQQVLTEKGYCILQKNGNLEYPNCRLVRMDYDWTCRGVTHEYWDGPTANLPRSVCHIDDRNDGGCKADKFERDARLLEQGLEEEPTNVRYMFYLAQTYHSLGRWQDCIAMYKKRIEAGGWEEEVWYSHYMIGQTWLTLGNVPKFQYWMEKAIARRPWRAEPFYKLTKYFREKGDQQKAWYYCLKCRSLGVPDDALFVEKDVYTGLFDYEATILAYYVKSPDGLKESMFYLLRDAPNNADNVYTNIGFYVKPLKADRSLFPIDGTICGLDFHPSSVSVLKLGENSPIYNVRFVNYSINHKTGAYQMKRDGNWSESHHVHTKNVCLFADGTHKIMDDSSIILPKCDTHIHGLEDIRLFEGVDKGIYFTATQREYSDKLRILYGEYDSKAGYYRNYYIIESPDNDECEKNWLGVPHTEYMIYKWHPLRIGKNDGRNLDIRISYNTPWFFKHLRGSAIAQRNGELWCLTHFVEYSTPRKYYHCMVILNEKTYKPLRISLPFVFEAPQIEYCTGMLIQEDTIKFFVSLWDGNPSVFTAYLHVFNWLHI